MPKSYTAHEACYRDLRKSGCKSWDQYHQSAADFDHFYMRPFVEMALLRSSFSFRAKALEIGCGTGPLSCFLASKGFCVDGVDISATAVAIAEEESRLRSHSIRFRVADICQDSLGIGQYELIVDGHCLHCIVEPSARRRAMSHILQALTPMGEFWVDSMIATNSTTFGDPHHLDTEGVLWTRIVDGSNFSDQALFDGAWHLPTRRLFRSSGALASELRQAGFSIEWSRDVPPDRHGEPAGFQAICKKAIKAEQAAFDRDNASV